MICPLVYEVNTRCWLRALSEREGRAITLANVPAPEIRRWRDLGFTHVWAMGVWTTGSRSRALALADENLRRTFTGLLPAWRARDTSGSPYAISRYRVPAVLGGEAGLQKFRRQLNAQGLKLLLDFVPNHLGLDHPWIAKRPGLFVRSPGPVEGTFRQESIAGPRWIAHGRDPNFPPWRDTAQIDYRNPEARAAMLKLLHGVARRCDGVRCDMAMLLLNEVFARTWAHLPAPAPAGEFWAEAISAVKRDFPGTLFLAEAYWGLEPQLQSLGFDYAYDKIICDLLTARRYADLRRHLSATPLHQRAARTHFLENHDERRIAAVLSPAEHRAAALLMLGLPGMRLLYEGQLHGWQRQTPVHLGRWPAETTNREILSLYEQLLAALKSSAVGQGEPYLLKPTGESANETSPNVIIIQWQKSPRQFDLVVVNLAPQPAQCRVPLAVPELAAHDWEMRDLLGPQHQRLPGPELAAKGLHIELHPHAAHLFHFQARRPNLPNHPHSPPARKS